MRNDSLPSRGVKRMPSKQTSARIVYAREFTERDLAEAQARGYLSHVMVEIEDGQLYPVLFYDVIRLRQDLEESSKHGRAFVADPGMIVLPEITVTAMENAVQQLNKEGFFEYLVPLQPERLATGNPLHWPP